MTTAFSSRLKMKRNQSVWTFVSLSVLYLTTTGAESHIDPVEGMLSFTQIAEQCGLECEVHEVITEDKYVLTLFHLLGDRTRPVFLLSGNLGSADDYIARGNTSLLAVLVEAGYDVWVGNWRGCKYGRRHLTLDPDRDHEFWNFSVHEYGKYDAAALIDYVLNKTGSKRVACIGWSLGTTAFYILGALRPAYIDKVAVVISLAPMGYIHHSVTFERIAPVWPLFDALAKTLDVHELIGENSTFLTVLRFVCRSKEFGYELCMNDMLFPLFGYDYHNLEPEITPVLFGHFPTSISMKNARHEAQIMLARRILKYDYGPTENLIKYGTATAPNYEFEKNNMSVVMISAKNDLVSTLPDVELLKALLPNVVDHVLLEPAEFSHLDFTYGKKTYEILYKTYVLDYLNKYL